MSTLTFRLMSSRALWLILAALALAVILALASPAQPAAASCGGVTTVNDETELNTAITAFNSAAGPSCLFTIQLSGDIALTASTTPIDNNTSGVSLVIEGNGKTVNGQGTDGIRPFTLNGGTVTINQITITGGNVIAVGDPGGGIYNAGGTLTVTNSTITGNQTEYNGGGIGNCDFCTLTVQNSTISGNTAGRYGGGIGALGTVIIDSSTLVNNQATLAGSALMVQVLSTVTVRNSILANSVSGDDCAIEILGSPGPGTLVDGGHNLVETPGTSSVNPSGCTASLTGTGTITGQDPVLGVLANNGGPTFTHALQAGSPALDAGDTALTTDQRGEPRPVGAADDIGAYEEQNPLAITLASFDAQSQAGHVLVTWETVSEAGNAGFNLYRTPSAQAPTAADLLVFVPSQGPGSTQGFAYAYQDQAVTAGETTWYWLADVDLNGAATLHGPVSVVYVGPTAVTLSGLEATQNSSALAWPWLAALLAAALAGAALVWRRRSAAA